MTGTDDAPAYVPEGTQDPTVRHRHDWTETDPAMAVVETLAATIDSEPGDMVPLYDVVDPDALNALLDPPNGQKSPHVQVSFRYQGLAVSVSNTGLVSVSPVTDRRRGESV